MSRSLANTAPATRTARACGAFTLASSSSKCAQYSRSRAPRAVLSASISSPIARNVIELGRKLRRRGRELREILGGFVVGSGGVGHALRGELRLVHRDRIAFGLIDDDALVERHGGRQRLGRAHQRLVLHEQLAHALARLAGALLSDEIRGNDRERDGGEADRDTQRHAGTPGAKRPPAGPRWSGGLLRRAPFASVIRLWRVHPIEPHRSEALQCAIDPPRGLQAGRRSVRWFSDSVRAAPIQVNTFATPAQ